MTKDYIAAQFENDQAEIIGIGSFNTLARISEKINRTRATPTSYLESGEPVNDHIIREPLSIQITGEVSDVFAGPVRANQIVRSAQASLGLVVQYLPTRTQSQISKVSALANDVSNAIEKADRLISPSNFASFISFSNDGGRTNIERFIDTMEGIYASDKLINVDAPFRSYKNMSLSVFDYERNNTTSSLSFNLQFVQFRFVESIFVVGDRPAKNPATANNGAQADEADKGIQEGKKSESLASKYLGGLFRD